ncbi:hypothetical protein IT774_15445 [Salinimonas marina]|uniref:Esterase-like activity of phytase family protein n=1 Tax=Salinimonas marina TaxID=2785918 RepID=A0A7S9HCP5_9ALTE|nr:hypothetical protein [Salinimonas marina]QPG05466.1 hypothetical protein IT774_15445 [Salinimonas marina]
MQKIQSGYWFRMVTLWLAVFTLPACSASDPLPKLTVEVLHSQRLDTILEETSGLVCTGDSAITLNDSGNAAALFRIDKQGQIQNRYPLDFANKDFEAVTADDNYFYIGDIGNNRGQRPYVNIRQVARDDAKKQQTLRLTYADNNPQNNLPYAHDYDAEALVNQDDHLLLFSKSWASKRVKVYRIAKDKKNQILTPVAHIDGLPGLVTGADWDAEQRRFVVVGYEHSPIGLFQPFVALIAADFTIEGVARLEQFGQVEGVCVNNASQIWLTQESTPLDSARLGIISVNL